MLEKMLAALPYNPSLLHQLSFYAKRMRAEQSVRRIGLVFIVLAFFIQFFAVLSPPQSTVAASNNDLINGGFGSAAQAANDCRANVQNYGTILANYGISCDTVAAAPSLTISSTSFNRSLYSMGRLPYAIAGETPVSVSGSTYYVRYLWGWDRGYTSSYQALNVTSTGGQTFFLLYNCGNLTSVGLPQPKAQPPALSISKTASPGFSPIGSTVAPGQLIGYRIVFNNTGGNAQNVTVNDTTPAHATYKWLGSGAATTYSFNQATNTATWTYPTLAAGTTNDYVDIQYTVNADTPTGTQICNVASINSGGSPPVTSGPACYVVSVTPKPAPPPVCKYNSSLPATSSQCYETCKYNSSIPATSNECKPCTQSLSSEDTLACVTVHKTASNTTQALSDANNTTAQPSDEIVYTLYAQNNGKATVSKYVFTEQLSDVLDYADVQNLYGGSINQSGQVTWPAMDIAAGQTASVKLSVKVKNPIPQTPTSSSDPGHFDLVMTNVYGNTINIKVPGSPAKTVEVVTTSQLVNTGPGTSLFIGGAIVMIAGYFFARSRLLAKEAVIAVHDNVSGGL